MKLNKILMALSAMAIVGCSSEDFNDPSVAQAIDDSRLIELNENFVLAGVGAESNITRTHWEQDPETKALVNKFLPIYNGDAVSGAKLSVGANLEAQAVGLCWVGQGAVGTDVYTNYQFYHFGWLNKGETEADVDNCDPVNLYNGAMYNDITLNADGTEGKEAVETNFTCTPPKDAENLNYNSGVYITKNKTIFGGKYIVYYPYNKDFQEKGTIPAKAETSFDWNISTVPAKPWEAPELGKNTFRYSAPVDIEGGMNAANFGLFNLSTLVRLNVFTATAADAYNNSEIDKVILYSESEKLLKQANLGADKIAAGKQGQELYAETEGTKTIAVNFTGTDKPELNVKASTEVSAYITVLPTTVDDLVAFVHATKGTESFWYRVELPATEFKAGKGQVINITVKEADITSDYIVVDQASLEAALVAANAAASESNPQTITVIGDVELDSDFGIDQATYAKGKYITIDGGAIIVPQDVTLTIEALKEMKSDIRVQGKDCCTPGVDGGRLVVNSISTDPITLNNITLEKTEAKVLDEDDFTKYNPMVTYQGAGAANIVIAKGKTVNVIGGTVKVDRAVEHKGGIVIGKDGKLIVEGAVPGDLNFLGSSIVNNGIIEVEKTAHFDITDEDGNASWADGQNMINNGKFIHQVDANVGTTVQNMQQNGEYRCKVDKQQALNDAYVKWTACSVIEMVDGATDYDLGSAKKHGDKYVDIEVNNSTDPVTFTNPDKDNEDIEIGNLTVTATSQGLSIDYQPSADGKKQRSLTVHGDMNVLYSSELTQSKKVTVDGNLNIEKGDVATTLTYKGSSKNKGGLEVTGDITVTDATFNASEKDALEIKCTNFSLIKKDAAGTGAAATFGLRSEGNNKSTMTVDGTISNPKGCTFAMTPASGTDLLAWITCKKLTVGGAFPGGKPQVVE